MEPLRDKLNREHLAATLIASMVRSIMSKYVWIIVPSLCAAPLASGEIFKCVETNGVERYQNFPCAIDSIGSVPSGPLSVTTTTPPSGANRARQNAAPVEVASTAGAANASEPRIGMTKEEITAIWGEPEEIIQDEPRAGRIEIWRYGDRRSVQFSNKHRVLAVQR